MNKIIETSNKINPAIFVQHRNYYKKVIGFTYIGWFLTYALIGKITCSYNLHVFDNTIDHYIPLIPEMIILYDICYLLPFVIIFMITDLKKINVLYLAIIICSISSYLVYVIFPVTFNKPIPGNTLFDKILLYNYAIDFHPTVNNLPSLHVAFTWIIYFAYKSQKPRRINNIIFCLLVISISVSTLFVKQHLIVDLICGFIWAILSWKVAKRICKSEHFNELSPILVFKRVNKKVLPLMILSSILILSIMIIKIF